MYYTLTIMADELTVEKYYTHLRTLIEFCRCIGRFADEEALRIKTTLKILAKNDNRLYNLFGKNVYKSISHERWRRAAALLI
jgi:hypothetical protein